MFLALNSPASTGTGQQRLKSDDWGRAVTSAAAASRWGPVRTQLRLSRGHAGGDTLAREAGLLVSSLWSKDRCVHGYCGPRLTHLI